MRLVAEAGDGAANGGARVDHRRASGPLHLPIEQGAEECLRVLEIAATDFKMNNGILHALPPKNRILPRSCGSAAGPRGQPIRPLAVVNVFVVVETIDAVFRDDRIDAGEARDS
jgi:hypothetical protein